ncbi:unnamed protein product [Cladocopium goreaui]|uniref:Neurofilament heavy polypeptide n=1 Tax=Cladocopium goreaui TaxID=2562237 RepID=A0A9P1DQB0_9DINO|nr:unnamed protein product [Cladocopium goreaui]
MAHARYMRFSRSLQSPRTPPEVRRAGRAAFRDSGMLQVLLEQWTSCAGVWTESEFYIQVKEKRKNRSYGSRRWMTRMEIVAKFGSTQVADQIISAKTLDAEETRQYLIWDREGEETTVDHVTTTLFQAAEKDEDEKTRGRSRVRSRKGRKHDKKHGKGKKSRGKKKKRSTSSTSDSSGTSSSDKPSSESEEKEAQQQHGTPAWQSLADLVSKRLTASKWQAKGKKASKKKATKRGKGKKRGKSSKSSDSSGQAGRKKRKEETEEQKLKREQKEQEAQQKKEMREQEKEREKEKKAIEKTKNDAFKKDLRKGNQAGIIST